MSASVRSDDVLSRTSSSSSFCGDASDKVFIAVKNEYKHSINTLLWVLRQSPRPSRVVLVHVIVPVTMVPMMGGYFPISQLDAPQVEAFRAEERAKAKNALNEYVRICDSVQVRAEKLVVQTKDIAKSLVDLIAKHKIINFVMGAAADKHYFKKMKATRSKTACTVFKEAPTFCNISFICKAKLICNRDATAECPMPSPRGMYAPTERTNSNLSYQDVQFSKNLHEYLRMTERLEVDNSSEASGDQSTYPHSDSFSLTDSTVNVKEIVIDARNQVEGNSLSSTLSASQMDGECRTGSIHASASKQIGTKDTERSTSNFSHSVQETESDCKSPDDGDIYFDKLQESLKETENLKNEAHEESQRRRRAEMELLEFSRKVKVLELKYAKEIKIRKEVEEALSITNQDLEKLKIKHNEASEELRKVEEKLLASEARNFELDNMINDYEDKLSEARKHLEYRQTNDNDVIKDTEVKAKSMCVDSDNCTSFSSSFREFTSKDIEKATSNFDDSLKVGENGHGKVFKGYLRHTPVAIKLLQNINSKGKNDFHQKVSIINKIRHPNIVNLIGASSEASALIYEFLPNGSLEDHLCCKNGTSPLSWQARMRILVEICMALIFLHSNNPSIVHGDLRPSNILFDAHFTSKIADCGVGHLSLSNSNTLYLKMDMKGSFAYLDPEFFYTGEVTPSSDIYSFGVILLRMLTGKPALGIVKEVQEAMELGKLESLLDPMAGDWPLFQAKQLASLGLLCCEIMRKSRPDLERDIWEIIEAMSTLSS